MTSPRDPGDGKSDATPPPESEITPPALYFNRRLVMRGGILAASALGTGWLYRRLNRTSFVATTTPRLAGLPATPDATASASGFVVDEPMTSQAAITHYNNFYEFSTDKDGVADRAAGFETEGWKVSVDGLVHKPRVFDLDDLRKISPPEERVYRMRCVEAWSMVIPWAGFSLSKLLDARRADGRREVRRVRDAARLRRACRARRRTCSTGRTSRGCAWTRRCTR